MRNKDEFTKKSIDYPKNRASLIFGGIGSILFFFFTYLFIIRMGAIESLPLEHPFMIIKYGIRDFSTFKFLTFLFSIILNVGEILMGIAILEYYKQYKSKLAITIFIFSLISGISLGIFFVLYLGLDYYSPLVPYLVYFGYPFLYTFFILISIGFIKIRKDTRVPILTVITGIVNIISVFPTAFIFSIIAILTSARYRGEQYYFGHGPNNLWTYGFGLLIFSCILIGITLFIESTYKTISYNQEIEKKA